MSTAVIASTLKPSSEITIGADVIFHTLSVAEVSGAKVRSVSPSIDENRFFFGVNGSDLQTSAGVYAPYMAIVPTQLLGFADGTMSQGFSTMYDMKLLSTYKIVNKAPL